MIAAGLERERDLRRRRAQRVAGLLDELEERRRRLYRLQAGGASRAGLRDQKQRLLETQQLLLAAVNGRGGGGPAAPARPRRGPAPGRRAASRCAAAV